MTFQKTLLRINSWLFIIFGVGFVFVPVALSALITGASPATASAITDMRATYGGMALGLAFIFHLLAQNEEHYSLGIKGVLVVMGALASARIIGMLFDGSPNLFMVILLVAEVGMAAAAFVSLRRS